MSGVAPGIGDLYSVSVTRGGLWVVVVALTVACSSETASKSQPYDRSCQQNTDCVAVPAMPCKCDCSYEAINVREQSRHFNDALNCGCSCLAPTPGPPAVCSAEGVCEVKAP